MSVYLSNTVRLLCSMGEGFAVCLCRPQRLPDTLRQAPQAPDNSQSFGDRSHRIFPSITGRTRHNTGIRLYGCKYMHGLRMRPGLKSHAMGLDSCICVYAESAMDSFQLDRKLNVRLLPGKKTAQFQ
jgi:hypothetical protein